MEKGDSQQVFQESNIISDKLNNDPDEVATSASEMIEEASKDLLKFKERNPDVDKINLRICQGILERLVSAATKINDLAPVDRETYFYVVHNANMVIYDI